MNTAKENISAIIPIDKFENIDYETVNLEVLEKEIKEIEKGLIKKYKDHFSEEDLDTEE